MQKSLKAIIILILIIFGLPTVFDSQTKTEEKEIKSNASVSDVGVETEYSGLYKVIKVVDGDTLSIDIDGEKKTIRLIGIDTPETVHPTKPVQCFGIEASNKAKELLTDKKVRLEFDDTQGEQDRYGRLLAYVFLEDGTNFNEYMIREGYAYEYTHGSVYKYQSVFQSAQKEAEENNRGLWGKGVCE